MSIADNYVRLRKELDTQCVKCGRNPSEVLLLAVSKTTGLDGVKEAISAGACDFGENRPDELIRKSETFPDVNWHFIGNIQSRRIPDIVGHASLIHSVCNISHVEKISNAAKTIGKVQDILLEFNISGEESKSGFPPEEAFNLLEKCMHMENICVRGFMTMAPRGDEVAIEKTFSGLSGLLERCNCEFSVKKDGSVSDNRFVLDQLSMGMSEDWKQAVVWGSTVVRIGRAIFAEDF